MKGVVRRLGFIAVMLAILSVTLFYLLHALPGSPDEALLAASPERTPEDVARLRSLRGLDRPILERYACWLVGRGDDDRRCAYWPSRRGVLEGELGYSQVYKAPVIDLLQERFPRTLALMLPALTLALIAALALGVSAALEAGRALDRAVSALCFLGMSIPAHGLALFAIGLFAVALGLVPAGGVQDPRVPSLGSAVAHSILPIVVLAAGFTARWTRYVRTSTLEVLELDFVRTARAKGLSERAVLFGHVVPNAAIPLVTVVAQSAPALFSGALVVETVFSYPGMGVLLFESIQRDDHLVAIVLVLAYALATFAAALVADGLYARLDPRIRDRWQSGAGR